MNWRAIGCGTLAAVVFVAVGLIGIWRAGAPPGCPDTLPYQPAAYQREGSPTAEPQLAGVDEQLVAGGRASFGLASWPVWVRPADRPAASPGAGAAASPAASGERLPDRIALDCGDGTFQAYRRGGDA